jgi:nicotinate-nucleotide pyrophosphorylase (carboxylating)
MSLLARIIELALAEDIHTGDITTESVVTSSCKGRARIIAKEPMVVAGLHVARQVFLTVDPSLKFTPLAQEGEQVAVGALMAELEGAAASLLTGERVALNFLQRLCGIATVTSHYVEAVKGTGARIVDTRKTTPGLRMLEKYAVRVGGGTNHRTGLYDGVLIKENHIAAAGGITEAVRRARQRIPHTIKVEVETETLDEVREAVSVGADIIMLDNMGISAMAEAVALIGGRALVEASGGMRLEQVRSVAETGVDIISVGALTHSARAMDISLLMEEL